MMREYVPILMIFAASLGVALIMVVGSQIFSNYRPTRVKGEPYESGMPAVGDTRERFAVKYYLVAMLFLLFDVEVVILFTWGVVFRQLGVFGYVTIMVFLAILVLAVVILLIGSLFEWECR